VDDPFLVRGHEPGQHLRHDVDHVLERQAPLAGDAVGERFAEQALHHEVRAAVVERAQVVDLADVRVADGARRARFLMKALHRRPLSRLRRVQHLHGDAAPQRDVLRLEHGAHPPLAEHRADEILPPDRLANEVTARARGHLRDGPHRGLLRRRRLRDGAPVERRDHAAVHVTVGRDRAVVVATPIDRLARGRADRLRQIVWEAAVRAAEEPLAHGHRSGARSRTREPRRKNDMLPARLSAWTSNVTT